MKSPIRTRVKGPFFGYPNSDKGPFFVPEFGQMSTPNIKKYSDSRDKNDSSENSDNYLFPVLSRFDHARFDKGIGISFNSCIYNTQNVRSTRVSKITLTSNIY